jgi:hypothetical protein
MGSQHQGSFIFSALRKTIFVAKDSKLNADAQEAFSYAFGLQSPEFYAECGHSLITGRDKCLNFQSGFVEKKNIVLFPRMKYYFF